MRLLLATALAFTLAACGSNDDEKFDGFWIEENAAKSYRDSHAVICSTESKPVLLQIANAEVTFINPGAVKSETKLGKVESDGKITYADSTKAPPMELNMKIEGDLLTFNYKLMDREYPYLKYSKSNKKEVDSYLNDARFCTR